MQEENLAEVKEFSRKLLPGFHRWQPALAEAFFSYMRQGIVHLSMVVGGGGSLFSQSLHIPEPYGPSIWHKQSDSCLYYRLTSFAQPSHLALSALLDLNVLNLEKRIGSGIPSSTNPETGNFGNARIVGSGLRHTSTSCHGITSKKPLTVSPSALLRRGAGGRVGLSSERGLSTVSTSA